MGIKGKHRRKLGEGLEKWVGGEEGLRMLTCKGFLKIHPILKIAKLLIRNKNK